MEPSLASNPFALMLDPQAVFQVMETSERLNGLRRRIHRPLDKPLLQQGIMTDDDETNPGVFVDEPVLQP